MDRHQIAETVKISAPRACVKLLPLQPSNPYWRDPSVQDGEFTLSWSVWAASIAYMVDRNLAVDEEVSADEIVLPHQEIMLATKLGARRFEAVQTLYSVPDMLDPGESLLKTHWTEGFCHSLVKELESGAIARVDKSLAAKLRLKKKAIATSGGLLGTFVF